MSSEDGKNPTSFSRGSVKNTDKELSFYKKKRRLRMIYKQWKVGMLQWEDIEAEDQLLLKKYYGVEEI